MHRVAYSIKTIPAAELPMIALPPGAPPRPMTVAELLNVGIVHLEDDLYSCVQQEQQVAETLAWAVHGPALPGVTVAEGSLKERHVRLPATVRGRVMRARVLRTDAKGKASRLVVPMDTIQPGDVVEVEPIIPHAWHGEATR
jgi:hypothetical protein